MNTQCLSSVQDVCYTNLHSNKQFLIPGWSKYPMVPCNGTSRRSLIGLDHWTSLGDDCELRVVFSRQALCRWVPSHHFVLRWKLFMIQQEIEINVQTTSFFFLSNTLLTFFFPLSHINIYTTYTCSSSRINGLLLHY